MPVNVVHRSKEVLKRRPDLELGLTFEFCSRWTQRRWIKKKKQNKSCTNNQSMKLNNLNFSIRWS